MALSALQARLGQCAVTGGEAVVAKLNAPCSASAVYLGIDPTAAGLHVGHLAGLRALGVFARHGWRPIVLLGGATGMIGDPSGRSSERSLLSREETAANVRGIEREVRSVLGKDCAVVDNLRWYERMSALDFVRDLGQHFRVGPMLARDSVKSRLESGDGLSFTELSYQVLQGYDFLELHRAEGCSLQLGGSDQWGNITAGCDLVRRVEGAEVHGVTFPLLTSAAGEKLGKSAGNAVWLSEAYTPHYDFYQYFRRQADADAVWMLRALTEMPLRDVEETVAAHAESPHTQLAQLALAEEMTSTVRGAEGLRAAQRASQVLFGGSLDGVAAEDLLAVARSGDLPVVGLPASRLRCATLLDLAVECGVCKSRKEAKRLHANGGFYVNNKRPDAGLDAQLDMERDFERGVLLFRSGKRNYTAVVASDEGAGAER